NPRLGVAQQSISSASPSAARTRHRRSGYKKRGLIRKSAGRRADRPTYWAASVAGELVGGLVDLVLGLLRALLPARRALVRLTFGLEVLVTGCRAEGLLGTSAQLLGLVRELVFHAHMTLLSFPAPLVGTMPRAYGRPRRASTAPRSRSSHRLFRRSPSCAEELLERRRALDLEHPTADLRPADEAPVAHDVPQGPAGAGARLPGAKDEVADPRGHRRPGTHGARLQRHDERAVLQPPAVAQGARGRAQRQHLGVGERVAVCLAAVGGCGQ